MSAPDTIRFSIEYRDIGACPADVVALKFARKFHGADYAVKEALVSRDLPESALQPAEGEFALVESRSAIRASQVLFVGTVRIGEFHYPAIREFAARTLAILKQEAPETQSLAMTIHGAGRGLDEAECALAQLRGILLAIKLGTIPPALKRIVICEKNRKRILRIQERLAKYLREAKIPVRPDDSGEWVLEIERANDNSRRRREHLSLFEEREAPEKPHAFIAMPFRPELDDIYFYGIQNPVHRNGLLCERVDRSAFTGDVLSHIRTRIEKAQVLIAELSDASPNVYLEIGYAWGRGVPTILLTKDESALKFDVRNQRCLVYQRIQDLEEILGGELKALQINGPY